MSALKRPRDLAGHDEALPTTSRPRAASEEGHACADAGSEAADQMNSRYLAGTNLLLVGEANLSFARAVCRARSTGGKGVVASTFEPRDELIRKYPEVQEVATELEALGAKVLFGVDATVMSLPEGTGPFETVVFNFPLVPRVGGAEAYRADPCPVMRNRRMLQRFLLRAAAHVAGERGEVHITSKDVAPYIEWQIPALLAHVSAELVFACERAFSPAPYERYGYESRKPENVNSERIENFAFTNCKTYIFVPRASRKGITAEQGRAGAPTKFYCHVCSVAFTGVGSMDDHMKGRKHKRRVALEKKWEHDMRARGLV